MLPACNGATMMRNIYQASAAQANASRNYSGYSGTSSINSMNAAATAARYPPMSAASAYPPMGGQPFGMAHTGGPMGGMGRQDQADAETDWYNKGFNALRMNHGAPHNHANLAAPMLQYQT